MIVALGFVGWVVDEWWRGEEGAWIAALVVVVLGVLVGSAFLMKPAFFSPRYFLVFLPFVYLAVAVGIVRVGAMRGGVWVAGILMGVFLVGQGVLYGRFRAVGRGNVSGALKMMAEKTSGPMVVMASSQDLRGLTEVQYFWAAGGGEAGVVFGSGGFGVGGAGVVCGAFGGV